MASGTMLPLLSVEMLKISYRKSLAVTVYDLTRTVMRNGCEDFTFGEGNALFIGATLRRVLKNPGITTCQDIKPYCLGVNPSTRTICPATCGCSLPRSGLYLGGEGAGCPRLDCQAAPKYQDALGQIPCEDPAPTELTTNANWVTFWEAWSAQMAVVLPSMSDFYQTALLLLKRDGCHGTRMLSDTQRASLCEGTSSTSSMADFCPVACNCTVHRYPTCPSTC